MGFLQVLAVLTLLLSGCSSRKDNVTKVRPIEPWAVRSVLDYRPRMLTVALDSEMYLAYDLVHCALYRAWKGGVNWDGTVFNEIKAMQPTAWGEDYYLNQYPNDTWSIIDQEKQIECQASFSGYRFENGGIKLSYRLIANNDTVYVSEKPEFVTQNGKPTLERKFSISNLKTDKEVELFTQSQKIRLTKKGKQIHITSYDPILKVSRPALPNRSADKGRYWIEKSDCFTCHDWNEDLVGPSFQKIAETYGSDEETIEQLALRVKDGGNGVWGDAAMNPHPDLALSSLRTMVSYILSLDTVEQKVNKKKKPEKKKKSTQRRKIVETKPGFGEALTAVHPSFEVQSIHPPEVEFKVGGLAFLSDGRLVVSTWSPFGDVFLLDNVETGDFNKINIKLIASGLAEPLGLEVVDDEIFVLQKHELTQLIDHDGDDIIDEYKVICNSFGVSTDFHEFALGLIHKDGYFYANLSLPLRLMENEKPHPDRGKTLKIAPDGTYEKLNSGLRTPNGLGIGINNEIFVTDNQGQWLPGNKFIHIRPGDFHGMWWSAPDFPDAKIVPPAVWLPQNEIANSPSEPTLIHEAPYTDQMIYGDVSHGGIKRVYLEKINGSYQGVVFRFTQGLEAGINRIERGPDGAYYVGGVGMSGGWLWKDTKHGLQRLVTNGKSTFEMLSVSAKADGFEIEFTEPLAENTGESMDEYNIQQWWYLPTENYGGPKMDLETMKVQSIQISDDRKKVNLNIPGLKKEHVVYFRLNDEIKSANNKSLWSGEAWYTLNNIPTEKN
ncbi:MAG: cytochrome C [Cyclobacteriaceae bacterium]